MSRFYDAFKDEFVKAATDDDSTGPAPSEDTVIAFLKAHPRPTDDEFHAWAKSKGFNTHKAEAVAYRIISDLVTKGESKGKHPAGVSEANVKRGVKIEAEHTPNKTIQRKITDDHNAELGKYYDPKKGLPKMEKELEKDACYAGFRDELTKIAGELCIIRAQEEMPGPDAIKTPQASGIEEPSATPGPPLREDESGVADSVGDLASMEARRGLESLLKTDDGKRAIRETLNRLDRSAQEVGSLKKALTRSLLRARREVFGPVRDPVQNLNEILEGNAFSPQPS